MYLAIKRATKNVSQNMNCENAIGTIDNETINFGKIMAKL